MNHQDNDGLGANANDGSPQTPRWVKISLIIAAVLLLVVLVALLAGGNHGPGRHMSLGEADHGLPTAMLSS